MFPSMKDLPTDAVGITIMIIFLGFVAVISWINLRRSAIENGLIKAQVDQVQGAVDKAATHADAASKNAELAVQQTIPVSNGAIPEIRSNLRLILAWIEQKTTTDDMRHEENMSLHQEINLRLERLERPADPDLRVSGSGA